MQHLLERCDDALNLVLYLLQLEFSLFAFCVQTSLDLGQVLVKYVLTRVGFVLSSESFHVELFSQLRELVFYLLDEVLRRLVSLGLERSDLVRQEGSGRFQLGCLRFKHLFELLRLAVNIFREGFQALVYLLELTVIGGFGVLDGRLQLVDALGQLIVLIHPPSLEVVAQHRQVALELTHSVLFGVHILAVDVVFNDSQT